MPIYILRYPHVSMTAIGFWDIRNFRTNPYEHYVQCSNMAMFPLVMLGAATISYAMFHHFPPRPHWNGHRKSS